MTVLWIALPERPRYEEDNAFDTPMDFILTSSRQNMTVLEQGSAYVDELPLSDEVVLILHARDVLILDKTAPWLKALSGQRLIQALPSLLEDEVLYFDKNHVALWRDSEDPTHMSFALVDKTWMRQIVDHMHTLIERSRVAMIPAHYFQEVGSVVAIKESGVSPTQQWVCHRLGTHVFQLLPVHAKEYVAQQGLLLSALDQRDILQRLSLLTEPLIDCRQFEFADTRSGWRSFYTRWRWPLMIAVAALVLHTVLINAYWLSLNYIEHQLRTEERSIAERLIPQLPKDVDPALALRHAWQVANQSAPTSDKDFVVLSAKLARILEHQPADAVTKLHYQQGSLEVGFKPGINMDTIKHDAQSQSVKVESRGGGLWQIK